MLEWSLGLANYCRAGAVCVSENHNIPIFFPSHPVWPEIRKNYRSHNCCSRQALDFRVVTIFETNAVFNEAYTLIFPSIL